MAQREMNESQQRGRIIESWMSTAVHDGGVDRYDDLHIDQIDKSWKHQHVWFDAALEAIRLAVATRDRLRLDFTVAVAWSLQTEKAPPVGDFTHKEYLESQTNWSPPSLYLFHRGGEPWTRIDVRSSSVHTAITKIADQSITAANGIKYWCYLEFMQDDELSRSVFGLG